MHAQSTRRRKKTSGFIVLLKARWNYTNVYINHAH